jgi:phosphohistidine phosphatase SixA
LNFTRFRKVAGLACAAVLLGAAQEPVTRPESCVGVVNSVQVEETSSEATVIQNAAAPAPKKINPAVPNAAAARIPTGGDHALVEELKKGGYILYFRHALTNWNEKDQIDPTLSNRALQRNLSEAGQREAATIGQAIKVLEIPIEKVLASPMWRCRDTAQFAFGEYDTTGLLYWKGPSFKEARIKMLGTSPAEGKNLVLIGHQDQLIPIIPGLKRDQLAEGDVLVIKPEGKGKFKVVRQVTPFEWAKLADIVAPSPIENDGDAIPSAQDTTGAKVIEKN